MIDKLIEQSNIVCNIYNREGDSKNFKIAIARLQEILSKLESQQTKVSQNLVEQFADTLKAPD
jgi:hypothetical protein